MKMYLCLHLLWQLALIAPKTSKRSTWSCCVFSSHILRVKTAQIKPKVNWKFCLKSSGLYEFLIGLDRFCVVLLEGSSPLNKCLNFDGLSNEKTIGQYFPMNCSKIGHSYEALVKVTLRSAARPRRALARHSAGTYISSGTLQSHLCFTSVTLVIHLFLSHSHVFHLWVTWPAKCPVNAS